MQERQKSSINGRPFAYLGWNERIIVYRNRKVSGTKIVKEENKVKGITNSDLSSEYEEKSSSITENVEPPQKKAEKQYEE